MKSVCRRLYINECCSLYMAVTWVFVAYRWVQKSPPAPESSCDLWYVNQITENIMKIILPWNVVNTSVHLSVFIIPTLLNFPKNWYKYRYQYKNWYCSMPSFRSMPVSFLVEMAQGYFPKNVTWVHGLRFWTQKFWTSDRNFNPVIPVHTQMCYQNCTTCRTWADTSVAYNSQSTFQYACELRLWNQSHTIVFCKTPSVPILKPYTLSIPTVT